MRRRVRRPSAALVIACGALLVALSGTSVASVSQTILPPNSVGESQLRASAVTSDKVKDETLQIVDIAPRARGALTGPVGSAGPAGPQGQKGDPGPLGIAGLEIVQAQSPSTSKNGKYVRAYCRGGRRVLAGGGLTSASQIDGNVIALRGSGPFRVAPSGRNRDGWLAQAIETNPSGAWHLTAYAVCAFVD